MYFSCFTIINIEFNYYISFSVYNIVFLLLEFIAKSNENQDISTLPAKRFTFPGDINQYSKLGYILI